MESKDCIEDSVFLFLVVLFTEHSISGKYNINFSGYDAGIRFLWGTDRESRSKTNFF
jgi:hypothetical protein